MESVTGRRLWLHLKGYRAAQRKAQCVSRHLDWLSERVSDARAKLLDNLGVKVCKFLNVPK
jgi:hypothetical protein